jgi:hypothetical protein
MDSEEGIRKICDAFSKYKTGILYVVTLGFLRENGMPTLIVKQNPALV